jgi:hypothetical protein
MPALKSNYRRRCAQSSPRVASFNARRTGALNMSVCYLHNDSDIDAECCRISLREKSPVRVLCLTGVVQSIQFVPNRAVGRRWGVELYLSTAASSTRLSRKARQRTP